MVPNTERRTRLHQQFGGELLRHRFAVFFSPSPFATGFNRQTGWGRICIGLKRLGATLNPDKSPAMTADESNNGENAESCVEMRYEDGTWNDTLCGN